MCVLWTLGIMFHVEQFWSDQNKLKKGLDVFFWLGQYLFVLVRVHKKEPRHFTGCAAVDN